MDQERTLLIVAVGVAVAVGCFVLWGPSSFRSKRKKGHVVGLMNMGHTCFLNTLLQALASCPSVMDWLLEHKNVDDGSLVSALRTVLLVLNGEEESPISDPYAPTEVISALIRHSWVISPGEQDAHELFHVLLETLEEETTSTSVKNGSLSDIFLPGRRGQGDDPVNLSNCKSVPNGEINCDGDQHTLSPVSRFRPVRRVRVCENDSAASMVPSVEKLPLHSQPNPLPFRGTLTSQLKCTQCGFKSALRFDKFDTLSLPLPTLAKRQQLTLQMLLDNFVSTEIVKDVTCTNCSKSKETPVQTTALKTLNFGKLPKCLCLHVVRTTWNRDGSPWKREDNVDFPEFLIMDNYTHTQVQRNARKMAKTLENGDKSKDVPFKMQANGVDSNAPFQEMVLSASSARHMYRLKAVVVHTGDINSGHFITYRKGPIKSLIRHRLLNVESKMEHPDSRESTRWFYTSDVVVRRATMCDALLSSAYMLFYERCILPGSRHT